MNAPEIAAQLAKSLGGEVEETAADHYARLLRPEGVGLVFRSYRGRVTVCGSMPAEWTRVIGHRGPWAIPSISFSAERPVEEMYDEIRRRLWPHVVTAYAAAEAAYHAENDRRDNVKAAADELASVLSTTAQESSYGAQDGYRVRTYRGQAGDGANSEWRPYHYPGKSGLRAEIRLDVPHELAVAIARTIADYEAAR